MKNSIIPIVFSADDTYAPILGVALHSLIKNANHNYEYDIYILYTLMSEEHKIRLKRLERKNVSITFFNVEEYTENLARHSSLHLSIETVYRLFIPEILKKYEKIIYLDSDIIVLGNIAEFYELEIEDKTLGVIREPFHKKVAEYWQKNLSLDISNGFNAGILLINTNKFAEQKVKEKCFKLLREDWKRQDNLYRYMDQDVLNIVCEKNTKFLNSEWNFQNQHLIFKVDIFDEYKGEYEKARKNPKIIHYASDKKPWLYPEYPFSEVFWQYAKETEFHEELLYVHLEKKIEDKINRNIFINELFVDYIFPFNIIPRKSNMVIYGAGRVGEIFQNQVRATNYCTLLLWSDKRYKELQCEKGLTVSSPESIKRVPYDYVVIAVEDSKIAEDIRNELVELGIEKDKIVWTYPKN